MSQKRFEAEEIGSSDYREISFVKKAGSALGAGAMAILAVGAVGIYAFLGKNSIPQDTMVHTNTVETTEVTIAAEAVSAENQTETETSQVAVTWKKAGIEEYDLVIETVKATETAETEVKEKTTKKTTEAAEKAEETSVTEKTEPKTETAAPKSEPEVEEEKSKPANEKKSDTEQVKACAAKTMYTNEKVNMRSGPSLDSGVLSVIAADTEITVTGYTDNWYRIKYSGSTGYCMKRYTTDEAPADDIESYGSDVISYTSTEFDMLCYVLQGEVGNCSESSKIAVANVIINRVKSPSFPGSIEGVLTQANQFTAIYGYYNGTTPPSQNTIDCARRALAGEDNSYGATYYYAPQYCNGSTAAWFESLTFCTEIDGQRYFK